MMQKDYLSFLKSECSKLAKNKDIFDIVLYGSAAKGKEEPGDIDALLIFREMPLKGRAETAQELKGKLAKKLKGIDIKTINLPELFESDFLARQAVLVEGYSLLHNAPFCERMGFKGYLLFTYTLKGLTQTDKTRFVYALSGRVKEGIVSELKAEPLGRGAVIVPASNSLRFEQFLQTWHLNYKKKSIMVSLL
ncbi:MAG: nucleotidyltransferase domain-containing protein [Nanoarchaeota archaeon]|nr:nucleotidyltransferase domain-containing protein [Nanoarchaeota archaeon]